MHYGQNQGRPASYHQGHQPTAVGPPPPTNSYNDGGFNNSTQSYQQNYQQSTQQQTPGTNYQAQQPPHFGQGPPIFLGNPSGHPGGQPPHHPHPPSGGGQYHHPCQPPQQYPPPQVKPPPPNQQQFVRYPPQGGRPPIGSGPAGISPGGQGFAPQGGRQVHHHQPPPPPMQQQRMPPQQQYSGGQSYGSPPPQTIESIRNMYMTNNSNNSMNGGGHQGHMQYPHHQHQHQQPPPQRPPPPIPPAGGYSHDPNLLQTKKRARGIGYDSSFSSLFNDKPQQDRWSMLRNSTTPLSAPVAASKLTNPTNPTSSTATTEARQQNQPSYNFDIGGSHQVKPQAAAAAGGGGGMRATDFYASMADVYIQKKQTSGHQGGREKYAAGYDLSQLGYSNTKRGGSNQIQNKKQQQQQFGQASNSNREMQSYGGQMSKKRKYEDMTNYSVPSQISDAPVQSQPYGSSQATNSQAQRKGKKKLKKGWHGDTDSCQNDPYGDDRFKGKKKEKGRRRDNDIEEVIEKGGSSQDKFESDFIDDESLGNANKISSEDEDYGSHKKKSKKDKKGKKDGKIENKLKKNNKPDKPAEVASSVDKAGQEEEEEYGISSNEIDEEELQGYMDDWEKSPVKEGKGKKAGGSKNNTTKNSSKSKQQPVKQLQRIQQSDDEPENETAQAENHENEEPDQSEEEDIYNSLTRYVPEAKKLKLKFRIRQKNDCVYLPDDFLLPRKTFDNLFDHQKQGIQWMYSLWQRQMGGVLGDDMGLGKTVQVAVFLKGLFDSEQIRKVLIVVPATMKVYWQEELLKWTADDFESPSENEEEQLNIMQFDDKKKQNRHAQMKSLRKNGGILITSYGMVTTERLNLTDMRYDVIVLDEGHKVKNKGTQFRKDITSLRVKGCRLVLTGTPLQNNLNELWSVFDFVQPKIFGNFEKFQIHYGAPIEKGLLKDSTDYEKKTSQYLSKELKIKYQDHFLRRTKKNIFSVVSSEHVKRPLRISELPLKTDIVIWLPLLETQKKVYRHILGHNQKLVDQLMQDGELKNALFILSYIKKLCLHPYLLQTTAISKKKNIGISTPEEDQILAEQERVHKESLLNVGIQTRRGRVNKKVPEVKEKKREVSQSEDKENQIKTMNGKLPSPEKPSPTKMAIFSILQNIQTFHNKRKIEQLINSSSKTKLLFRLMQTLKDEGHRVLIFSISKKMLDLLEFIIKNNQTYADNFKYMRIDGDTEIASREHICKQFNNDKSFFCGLLTTKVGGFGLNLTGADRAIIMDPDWNPANDNQAVDRCYRIGQKRDVIVYRLVTIGGIEEMIYRRQVHKKAMNLATIEGAGKQQDHEISSSQESDNGGGDNDKNNKISDEKAFDKYFNDSDLFRLFVFTDDDDNCATLKMIMKQNGFDYERTPTNLRHIKYLQDQDDLIKGTTLNSNLYISKEDIDKENMQQNQSRELDVIEGGGGGKLQQSCNKESNINFLSQRSKSAAGKAGKGGGGYSQSSYTKKLSQNSTSKSPMKPGGGLALAPNQLLSNKQQQRSQSNSQNDIKEPADIFKALSKDEGRRIN